MLKTTLIQANTKISPALCVVHLAKQANQPPLISFFIHEMSSPSPATYNTPPALIAFTLTIVVICFICFSLVYFSRCYFVSIIQTWAFHHSASSALVHLSPSNNNNNNASSSSPFRGLDPSLLESFPTFPYSSVKDLRKEETKKYSLECAICLVEFEDDSMLRLLTICRHVFHQDCVDLWLRSHKTCPVCRTDLETRKSHHDESSVVEEEDCGGGGEVCIDVKESEGGGREERFSRSHSTGHSIVMVRGGGDGLGRDGDDDDDSRYTLRLQEHAITLRVVRGGHNCTKSCATYKEMMMMVARPAAPCSNCGYVQTVSGCSSRIGIENV